MAKETLAGLFALMHAAESARTHLESKLDAVNLSHAKLSALQALYEADNSIPLTELAARLSCVKSNVTQLVDRLEADGFVRREGDPKDRRTRLAVMTASGRKAYEHGARIHDQAVDEMFSGLSTSESRQLTALIEKLKTPRQ